MICAHCGCENPENITYCRDCGMSLRASAARQAVSTPTPELAQATYAPRTDVVCTRCAQPNPISNRFCFNCGLVLSHSASLPSNQPEPAKPVPPPSALCSSCKKALEVGAEFCKFCGTRVGAIQANRSPMSTQSESVKIALPALPLSKTEIHVASNTPQAHSSTRREPIERPSTTEFQTTRLLNGFQASHVHGRLICIGKDGQETARIPLVGEQTDLGRSEGNVLLPDDPYLSPRHARIVVQRDPHRPNVQQLVLMDLNSVNGVFTRIRTTTPLVDGDLLFIGQQMLRFEVVVETEGARSPAMQHGVLLLGSPAPACKARFVQRTVNGLSRDVFYMIQDEFVLGRESGDRIFPDDAFMSRRHAAIRYEEGSYTIFDVGSSNGTFLRIRAEHILQEGDEFRMGHHLFRVDLSTASGGNV